VHTWHMNHMGIQYKIKKSYMQRSFFSSFFSIYFGPAIELMYIDYWSTAWFYCCYFLCILFFKFLFETYFCKPLYFSKLDFTLHYHKLNLNKLIFLRLISLNEKFTFLGRRTLHLSFTKTETTFKVIVFLHGHWGSSKQFPELT